MRLVFFFKKKYCIHFWDIQNYFSDLKLKSFMFILFLSKSISSFLRNTLKLDEVLFYLPERLDVVNTTVRMVVRMKAIKSY